MAWSFAVQPISIGLEVGVRLESGELIHRTTLRMEGIVIVGDPLIQDTTVYAQVYVRDDNTVRSAQEDGILGAASVSKDVMNVRKISGDDPSQIAGIDIWIPLPQLQFRELLADLALGDGSRMTWRFGCVGSALVEKRPLAGPELVLSDENVKLSVVEFGVNFLLHQSGVASQSDND